MLTKVTALPRRVLHGGAAGDAGAATGRHIASNVVVQLAVRVITMGASIITVSFTARTLHPSGYGVWTGTGAYIALFAVFTELGLTTAAMQRMAAEPEREAEWLGALASARAALSLVATVLCAASIPLLLSDTENTQAVALILTPTILSGGAATLITVFSARLRAGLALSFTVLQSLLWVTAVLVLSATHASITAFACAYTALIAVISALQLQVTRKFAKIAVRAGIRLWRPLIRVAIPLGIASVFITVYYQLDSVLLLQIAGSKEAGIYGAAYGFLGPLTFLPTAVMSSFFPVMSAVHATDPARVRRLIQIAADWMGVISLPILAGTIALSDQIIHLLYGSSFERSGGLLPILMIAFVSICFGSLAGFTSPILNLQWRLALYSGIGVAANVALNLVLIPPYGAYGSAWATVATEILTMVLMLGTILWRLRLRLSPWKLLRTVALAAAMTGLMVLARPLGLIPAGVIGVAFYAVGLFGARIVNLSELRALREQRA
jgi:O-antigen/teichoic acid export membrane protein